MKRYFEKPYLLLLAKKTYLKERLSASRTGLLALRQLLRALGASLRKSGTKAEEPAGPTLLYALKVPSSVEGPLGDTLFLDAADASFEGDEELRGLRARHCVAHNGGQGLLEYAKAPAVLHPVVRRHPLTQRDVVFVNEAYVSGIEGLSLEASKELLERLQKRLERRQWRHSWREGDVLAPW